MLRSGHRQAHPWFGSCAAPYRQRQSRRLKSQLQERSIAEVLQKTHRPKTACSIVFVQTRLCSSTTPPSIGPNTRLSKGIYPPLPETRRAKDFSHISFLA